MCLFLDQETVRLVDGKYPEVWLNGTWSPICGHYFWNNQEGAKAFCEKLGLSGGTHTRGGSYSEDAIEIGTCQAGEAIDSCTGANNHYKNSNWCKAGNEVKLTISCDGNAQGSEKKTCRGKMKR